MDRPYFTPPAHQQPPCCSTNQAENRKRSMMAAIRKDPANRVTERDKAQSPMEWVQRMNNFQARVHEIIYNDLIYA